MHLENDYLILSKDEAKTLVQHGCFLTNWLEAYAENMPIFISKENDQLRQSREFFKVIEGLI